MIFYLLFMNPNASCVNNKVGYYGHNSRGALLAIHKDTSKLDEIVARGSYNVARLDWIQKAN